MIKQCEEESKDLSTLKIQRRHYETTKGKAFTTYSDICTGLTRNTDISLQYLKGEWKSIREYKTFE